MKGTVQLRYALVNEVITEPQKDENGGTLHGKCPHCGGEVVAKCGNVKAHHWSHVSGEMCDKWWENKTEWHIQWQNLFPKEWHEKRINNKNGNDWHIADICTADGLVVEFQHSNITADEQQERENFYKIMPRNMIWVVDIWKKREVDNLNKGIVIDIGVRNINYVGFRERMFPKQWLDSDKFVFYDCGLKGLYFLFPSNKGDWFLIHLTKDKFKEIVMTKKNLEDWVWDNVYNIVDWYHNKDKVRKTLLDVMKIDAGIDVRYAIPPNAFGIIDRVNVEMQKRYPRK